MDHPAALFIVLVIIIVVLKFAEKKFRRNNGRDGQAAQFSQSDPRFNQQPNNWLDRVSIAEFSRQPIMNRGEYKVFSMTERLLQTGYPGHRVFAQTSLGEVLRCADRDTFLAINSKRVDILVINEVGLGVLAVEYQGSGHYQKNAPMRDAIKKEALRRAGIPTIEISGDDDPATIKTKITLGLKQIPGQTARETA